MIRPSIINSHAVCTACGWTGKYIDAKHRSHNQLLERGVINEKGHIIDAYLLNVKRRNCGALDLTWCPNCDNFIEVYYEEMDKTA